MRKVLILVLLTCLSYPLCAAELAPDDVSISGDLKLWLRHPVNNFQSDTGIWLDLSGNGNDATPVGLVDFTNPIDYLKPSLSAVKANDTIYGRNLSTVRFDGQTNDLIAANELNGGTGLDELTIFAVYQAPTISNALTRPVGFVSVSSGDQGYENPPVGNAFNLATDPSIRKDNGSIRGHSAAHPNNVFFIRAARMSANGVSEWFNTDGTTAKVLTDAGTPYTTTTDNFYLGDLRAGITPNLGASTSTANIHIAEVVVYNASLTDTQIEEINEWLMANIGLPLNPVVAVAESDDSTLVNEASPSTADTFTVVLTDAPASDVSVTISSGNSDPNTAGYRPNSDDVTLNGAAAGQSVVLTFDDSNWDQPKTVEVRAADDEDKEGIAQAILSVNSASDDAAFNGGSSIVIVTIVDDDAAGLVISETEGSTEVAEAGNNGLQESDTFDVSLATQPTSDVVITLSEADADPNDLVIEPSEILTFTPSNYDTPQTITVTAIDDDFVETNGGNQPVSFTIATSDLEYQNVIPANLIVKIYDNECGSDGYLSMDFNQDCIVDLIDFAEFAKQWLDCTYPNDPQCE